MLYDYVVVFCMYGDEFGNVLGVVNFGLYFVGIESILDI